MVQYQKTKRNKMKSTKKDFERFGKKGNKSIIISILLSLIIICFFLTSCGTRKVENQELEIKSSKMKDSSSIELIQELSLNDILIAEPKDKSKPMIINGKSYYNASVKIDKTKKIKTEKKEIKKSEKEKKSDRVKVKKTEREDYTFFVVIILILIMSYYIFTPNKPT